jgi:hypothetical protein
MSNAGGHSSSCMVRLTGQEDSGAGHRVEVGVTWAPVPLCAAGLPVVKVFFFPVLVHLIATCYMWFPSCILGL